MYAITQGKDSGKNSIKINNGLLSLSKISAEFLLRNHGGCWSIELSNWQVKQIILESLYTGRILHLFKTKEIFYNFFEKNKLVKAQLA